jgi:hypothetical protein
MQEATTTQKRRHDNRYFETYRQGARVGRGAGSDHCGPPWAKGGGGSRLWRGDLVAGIEEHGVADVCGVDGEYIDRDRLGITPGQFIAADLRRGVSLNKRSDLVMSLEGRGTSAR